MLLCPAGPSQLGSAASPYWRKLQALLEQYDAAPAADGSSGGGSSQQQGALRLAAVDEILQVDAHMALPHWLLDMFQVGATAGWGWWLLLHTGGFQPLLRHTWCTVAYESVAACITACEPKLRDALRTLNFGLSDIALQSV